MNVSMGSKSFLNFITWGRLGGETENIDPFTRKSKTVLLASDAVKGMQLPEMLMLKKQKTQ